MRLGRISLQVFLFFPYCRLYTGLVSFGGVQVSGGHLASPLRLFYSTLIGARGLSCVAGSYILASNTVEFDMPAYLGLYPSFLVAATRLQLFTFYS